VSSSWFRDPFIAGNLLGILLAQDEANEGRRPQAAAAAKRPQGKMQRREANEQNGEFDGNIPDNLLAQDEAFDDDLPGNHLAQDEGIMQQRGANERNGEFDDNLLGNLLA